MNGIWKKPILSPILLLRRLILFSMTYHTFYPLPAFSSSSSSLFFFLLLLFPLFVMTCERRAEAKAAINLGVICKLSSRHLCVLYEYSAGYLRIICASSVRHLRIICASSAPHCQKPLRLKHLIIHFPTTSQAREWVKERANQWAQRSARAKRMSERMNERAIGRASGPVPKFGFLVVLNLSGEWNHELVSE